MNKILSVFVLILICIAPCWAYENPYSIKRKERQESKSGEFLKETSVYDSNGQRCRVRDNGIGKKIYGQDSRVYKERANGQFCDEDGNVYNARTSGYKTTLDGSSSISGQQPPKGFKESPAGKFFRWSGRGIKSGYNTVKDFYK